MADEGGDIDGSRNNKTSIIDIENLPVTSTPSTALTAASSMPSNATAENINR